MVCFREWCTSGDVICLAAVGLLAVLELILFIERDRAPRRTSVSPAPPTEPPNVPPPIFEHPDQWPGPRR